MCVTTEYWLCSEKEKNYFRMGGREKTLSDQIRIPDLEWIVNMNCYQVESINCGDIKKKSQVSGRKEKKQKKLGRVIKADGHAQRRVGRVRSSGMKLNKISLEGEGVMACV